MNRLRIAWFVLVATVACAALLGAYGRAWPSDNRVQTWTRHGGADPAYTTLVERFGGDEAVLVRCDGFAAGDERALAWLVELGPRLALLPAVLEVADPLHLPGPPLDSEDPLGAVSERPLVRSLDLVALDPPRVDFVLAIDASALEPVRAVLAAEIARIETEASASGVRARAAGHPLVASALDAQSRRVDEVFGPLLALAAFVAAAVALRSLPLALVALLPAVIGSLGVRAALRAADWPSNLILVASGPLVFVIVLATVFHVVVGFRRRFAAGIEQRNAAFETLRDVAGGAFFATVTTAIGFGVFLTSSIEAVQRLGIAVALAVLVCVPLGLVLATLLLAGLPLRRPRAAREHARAWRKLPLRAARARWTVIAVGIVIIAAGAAAPAFLRRSTNGLEFFDRDHPLRTTFEAIEREGGSLSSLDVLVTVDEAMKPLEIARAGLASDLASVDGVRGVFGPEAVSDEVSASAGPMAALVLPTALQTAKRFDPATHTYRWTVRFESGGAEHFDAIAAALEARARACTQLTAARSIDVTGTMLRVLGMQKSLTGTLVSSMALNLAATVLLFLLVVRSARELAAAVGANLVPVAASLAAAWALGFALDAATVMVSSVVLGLAVDNTFHLLLAAGRTRARNSPRSVARAYQHVGPPALLASLSLALGFSMLTFSGFAPTSRFGGLTALGMLAASYGALLFLPAAWMRVGQRNGTRATRTRSASVNATSTASR